MEDKQTANNTTPDYSHSGFKSGFLIGYKQALTSLAGRRFRYIPWPAPSMPTISEHLEQHCGTSMSAAEFNQAEQEWHAMLKERQQAFDRFLNGYRIGCAACVLTTVLCWVCVAVVITVMLPR